MIQSVNLPPSAHTITSSAHPVHTLQQSLHLQCTLQPCTAICSQPLVHTAANCSHLQPSTLQLYHPVHTAANCSHLQPSTLQLYHPVHTAATLSGSNTIQCILCTSGLPQGKPIPLLAYLQSSQQTLMVDCSSP